MRSQVSRRRLVAEINVVPYIDVMLVLLIIFMITTPLLTQGVDIDLPKAQSKVIDAKQAEPIIVSVNSRGEYFLNIATEPQVPMSPQALATRIAAEAQIARSARHALPPILVKGDRYVAYGKVVQAMVFLQRLGISKIGLMTESLPQQQRA